jgi:hypothetical protein
LKNKALEIISTFTKDELKEFGKFLNSPYFNNNSKVTEYHIELAGYYSASVNVDIDEREIFGKIYPDENYRDERMRKLSSELYKMAQRYISQKKFDNDSLLHKRFLMEEYSKRKLDNLFELKISDIKKNGAEAAKEDFRQLHELFLLENAEVQFHLERNNQAKTIESARKRAEYLVTYFLMMLFKSIDDMESNVSVYNAEYESTVLYEFDKNFNSAGMIDFMKNKGSVHSHSLIIFYSLFRAWKEFENESLYFEAKTLVENNFDKINMQDKESVFLIMMNYCIKKFYYTQDIKFNHEKFYIYKLYLKHELYKNSKNLSRTIYMNILKLAVMMHEFDWARDFVHRYVTEFVSEDAEMTKHFSYAIITFHSQDFEASLKESAKVTAGIDEMGDKIGLKTYIICSHYELGNYDAAYEELKNMKIFLKNKKISKYFSEPALNYTRAVTKLLSRRLSHRRPKDSPISLEKTILNMGVMNFQGWILKKAKELN